MNRSPARSRAFGALATVALFLSVTATPAVARVQSSPRGTLKILKAEPIDAGAQMIRVKVNAHGARGGCLVAAATATHEGQTVVTHPPGTSGRFSGKKSHVIAFPMTPLDPDTRYALVVTWSCGQASARGNGSFRTMRVSATTLKPSGITMVSALIHGTVNAHRATVNCFAQYQIKDTNGDTVTSPDLGGPYHDRADHPQSALIGSLKPDSVHRYRWNLRCSNYREAGAWVTFRTRGGTVNPSCSGFAARSVPPAHPQISFTCTAGSQGDHSNYGAGWPMTLAATTPTAFAYPEAAGDWTHVAGQPGFEPACDPSPSDAHTVLCSPGETGFDADSDFVDWPVADSTGSKLFDVCGLALKVVVTVTPPSAPPLVIGKAIGLNVRC